MRKLPFTETVLSKVSPSLKHDIQDVADELEISESELIRTILMTAVPKRKSRLERAKKSDLVQDALKLINKRGG